MLLPSVENGARIFLDLYGIGVLMSIVSASTAKLKLYLTTLTLSEVIENWPAPMLTSCLCTCPTTPEYYKEGIVAMYNMYFKLPSIPCHHHLNQQHTYWPISKWWSTDYSHNSTSILKGVCKTLIASLDWIIIADYWIGSLNPF